MKWLVWIPWQGLYSGVMILLMLTLFYPWLNFSHSKDFRDSSA